MNYRAVFYSFSLYDNFYPESIVYEERHAFGMMRKITVMKEILCNHIVVFTSSLIHFFVYSHSLAVVFIEPFHNFFHEVHLLKWPVIIKNFALSL